MLPDDEHPTPPETWTEDHIVENLAVLAELGVGEFAWDLNIAEYEPGRQVELLEALPPAGAVGGPGP